MPLRNYRLKVARVAAVQFTEENPNEVILFLRNNGYQVDKVVLKNRNDVWICERDCNDRFILTIGDWVVKTGARIKPLTAEAFTANYCRVN